MKIAFASDHAGVGLKAELIALAGKLGHDAVDLGPSSTESVDYPDFAEKACAAVTGGQAQLGVLICGTGQGMNITANKVRGIRAALCHTEFEARMARAHNDANVLCLGQRVTGPGLAAELLTVFVATAFEGGRHAARVAKITQVEARR